MDRVGVGFSGGMSPQDIVECVKLAEELGYESAWVAEGHGGDQSSVLTACAVATERIKLGTSITSVYVRTAPTIAMAAASVDYFSNGRFILGLGTSHKVQVEPEHGLKFTRPVQRLRECVDIDRAILKDSDVNYHGEHGEIYNIDRFDLWFEPLRQEIPIYVAAVFPKMLRSAARSPRARSLPGVPWTTRNRPPGMWASAPEMPDERRAMWRWPACCPVPFPKTGTPRGT